MISPFELKKELVEGTPPELKKEELFTIIVPLFSKIEPLELVMDPLSVKMPLDEMISFPDETII